MTYLADVAALTRKDLRVELRGRDTLPAMLLFVLSTLVVFHFALPEGSGETAAYGLLWWLNRRGVIRGANDPVDAAGQPTDPQVGRLVQDASPALFAALGLGGQVVMVDPASHTVVVRLGPANSGGYGLRDAARVVTWALR